MLESPADITGIEMETITMGRPRPDPDFPNPGRYEKRKKRHKPRRAQETGVSSKLLITLCFFVGLIGAFIGNVLASFL